LKLNLEKRNPTMSENHGNPLIGDPQDAMDEDGTPVSTMGEPQDVRGAGPADMERVEEIEGRVGEIGKRVGEVDERVGRNRERFGQISKRVGKVEERVGQVDDLVGQVNNRVRIVEDSLNKVAPFWKQPVKRDELVGLLSEIGEPPREWDALRFLSLKKLKALKKSGMENCVEEVGVQIARQRFGKEGGEADSSSSSTVVTDPNDQKFDLGPSTGKIKAFLAGLSGKPESASLLTAKSRAVATVQIVGEAEEACQYIGATVPEENSDSAKYYRQQHHLRGKREGLLGSGSGSRLDELEETCKSYYNNDESEISDFTRDYPATLNDTLKRRFRDGRVSTKNTTDKNLDLIDWLWQRWNMFSTRIRSGSREELKASELDSMEGRQMKDIFGDALLDRFSKASARNTPASVAVVGEKKANLFSEETCSIFDLQMDCLKKHDVFHDPGACAGRAGGFKSLLNVKHQADRVRNYLGVPGGIGSGDAGGTGGGSSSGENGGAGGSSAGPAGSKMAASPSCAYCDAKTIREVHRKWRLQEPKLEPLAIDDALYQKKRNQIFGSSGNSGGSVTSSNASSATDTNYNTPSTSGSSPLPPTSTRLARAPQSIPDSELTSLANFGSINKRGEVGIQELNNLNSGLEIAKQELDSYSNSKEDMDYDLLKNDLKHNNFEKGMSRLEGILGHVRNKHAVRAVHEILEAGMKALEARGVGSR